MVGEGNNLINIFPGKCELKLQNPQLNKKKCIYGPLPLKELAPTHRELV